MWPKKNAPQTGNYATFERRILKRFQPAFQFCGPDIPIIPLIMSSPHSGRLYPNAFLQESRLPKKTLRRNEDAYVDRIIAPLAAHGISQITAPFPRVYVDVNRAAHELPPDLAMQTPSAEITPRARAGLGVIPTRIGAEEIYTQAPDMHLVKRRLEALYHPWHQALHALIRRTYASYGQCLLLDVHSMPPQGQDGQPRADIILGNAYAQSTHPHTTALIRRSFETAGFSVTMNIPFSGGYITRHYGKPDKKIEVMQIEINKSLYLDARTQKPGPQFGYFQARFTRAIRSIWAELSIPFPDAAQ